jgi:threonine aldolase
MIIDFRSDTVTRPTPGMLQFMMQAQVGDDVFGDDPSVNELEAKAAAMFGMEAGLFCPTGTMTNQIAIKVHTKPLDEVVCDKNAHIHYYEAGGMAFNSGVTPKLLSGDRGRFTAKEVEENINPDNVHFPRTTLVCVENTTNRGGGACYSFQMLKEIGETCRNHQLKYHLDGARLFNALAETNETPKDYGKLFDSISICLSKGLGTPVGSVLLGNKDFIKEARRVRKVLGGGMRQAGYLAAAGIYALDHHTERLKNDHQKAKQLEEALKNNPHVKEVLPVETNIVVFRLKENMNHQPFIDALNNDKILFHFVATDAIRLVTHLDITDEMMEVVLKVLKN